MTENVCVVCGKKFDSYRFAKYCSGKCYIKIYYSRPEVRQRIRKNYLTRVYPSQSVEDFFEYAKRNFKKFKSVEEFKQTALNYTKATCSIEGNCKIQKRIVEDERFKLCCDLIERRLSGLERND